MRGRVLGWDTQTNQGLISGEDGQRYLFTRPDWRDAQWPQSGMLVDFDSSGNAASAIFLIGGASGMVGHKDKIVAAVLAFFLGALGVHKFYLGKTGAGITMLLCGTLGWLLILPGLFVTLTAFIEFIIYLVTDDAEFQRRYVEGDRAWF